MLLGGLFESLLLSGLLRKGIMPSVHVNVLLFTHFLILFSIFLVFFFDTVTYYWLWNLWVFYGLVLKSMLLGGLFESLLLSGLLRKGIMPSVYVNMCTVYLCPQTYFHFFSSVFFIFPPNVLNSGSSL